MSGAVTDNPTGVPVGGVWVLAIGPNGIAGGAVTTATGVYSITGLVPGTYRAAFVDPVGGRTLEYFNGSADFASATPFSITAAVNSSVSANLTFP